MLPINAVILQRNGSGQGETTNGTEATNTRLNSEPSRIPVCARRVEKKTSKDTHYQTIDAQLSTTHVA